MQNIHSAQNCHNRFFKELGKAIIICHLQCHGSGSVLHSCFVRRYLFFFAQTTRRHPCHDEGGICIQKRQFNTYFPTQKSVRILQLCVTRLFLWENCEQSQRLEVSSEGSTIHHIFLSSLIVQLGSTFGTSFLVCLGRAQILICSNY